MFEGLTSCGESVRHLTNAIQSTLTPVWTQAAEQIHRAVQALPQNDDAVWRDRIIIWKEASTRVPALTAWLARDFRADAMRRLKPGIFPGRVCRISKQTRLGRRMDSA